jgi:hypothetical protein
MLPDLRFAIGAVLASALLIVAAFGLTARVRVAHHRTAVPDDPWRMVADPADWGLLADRSRPTTVAETVVPEALRCLSSRRVHGPSRGSARNHAGTRRRRGSDPRTCARACRTDSDTTRHRDTECRV